MSSKDLASDCPSGQSLFMGVILLLIFIVLFFLILSLGVAGMLWSIHVALPYLW